MRALRLPDLRGTAALLPHLYVLPGAGDAGENLRPDRGELPPGLCRRDDGHGSGSGQGQHRAGLFGGGKHQLKKLLPEREKGPSRAWNELFGALTPNFYFDTLYCTLRLTV